MGEALVGAIALMLILEGLLPFLSPQRWRAMFLRAVNLTDGQLRFIGLVSIAIGLGVLWLWR